LFTRVTYASLGTPITMTVSVACRLLGHHQDGRSLPEEITLNKPFPDLLIQIINLDKTNSCCVVYAAHDSGVVARWQLCDDCRLG
jgi:hypothetical protein